MLELRLLEVELCRAGDFLAGGSCCLMGACSKSRADDEQQEPSLLGWYLPWQSEWFLSLCQFSLVTDPPDWLDLREQEREEELEGERRHNNSPNRRQSMKKNCFQALRGAFWGWILICQIDL